MQIAHGLAGIFLALTPVAALAQSDAAPQTPPQSASPPEKNVLEGNYLTIGGGAVIGPSYEGSNNYVVFPIPAIQGKVAGVAINPRAGGVALDFVPDPKGAKVGFMLGPTATYSANRDRHIADPVVRAAGRLDADLAVGASTGVTLYRVLDKYDSLSAAVDVKWDVHGPHGGMQISPSVSYLTPLSKALVVALSVSAKHVNDDYADYYYSVSPAQSFASGLPLYRAKGGWASVGATMVVGYSLSGDLRKGGFSLVGIAGYSRLLNDASDNPYTSIRGSPTQLVGGAGIAFTF
ncbi:MipA/OmpV family protein [Novosphingobium terrae]|uniref:MipA/OmpV family protein n=1 Tax=Novosphingobium terrae TaxID=2726189 RepID=UPI00197EA0A0|nr:MipA/OmpV family protein [Novosphingobium terrae]